MMRFFLFIYLIFNISFLFAQNENAAEGKSASELENKIILIPTSKNIDKKKADKKNINSKIITKKDSFIVDNSKKDKNNIEKSENQKSKTKILKPKKYKKQHYGNTKKTKKLTWWRPWLDLDWLMIAIFALLGIGLFIGLWFLFLFRTSLSLFQAILLAISFGIALVFLIHSLSEEKGRTGWYEYFIRFGFIAFPGWLLLLAGFVALFGGTPSLLTYLIIGGILGGISFLLSILVWKDSIFDVPWR
ncbi:MAG: hypothetical protein EAZ85_09870 [Bacteroidetes bacterium]|nr:MAG: hypothetical protein EAZ85_09870 [Bacteroidota bacterium]TAG86649.1 MAG: hypothetical protein EAZ20_12355 [Bacteroidota bacterium]